MCLCLCAHRGAHFGFQRLNAFFQPTKDVLRNIGNDRIDNFYFDVMNVCLDFTAQPGQYHPTLLFHKLVNVFCD